MATFPNTFRRDSARIHGDHQELLSQLLEFSAALEAMGLSPLSVDPIGAGRVRRCANALQRLLPGHFLREEATLLDAVAPVSPELAEFSRQMHQEHRQFTARLNEFAGAVAQLEAGDHGGPSLRAVQETGEVLAHDLAAHIELEESQLDGFL